MCFHIFNLFTKYLWGIHIMQNINIYLLNTEINTKNNTSNKQKHQNKICQSTTWYTHSLTHSCNFILNRLIELHWVTHTLIYKAVSSRSMLTQISLMKSLKRSVRYIQGWCSTNIKQQMVYMSTYFRH